MNRWNPTESDAGSRQSGGADSGFDGPDSF